MSVKIERLAEVCHDAYELAAAGSGWVTQLESRKPWAEVPEENRQATRAGVQAVLDDLVARLQPLATDPCVARTIAWLRTGVGDAQ